MKYKYIDPERERFQYTVRATVNGYAVQAHVMPTNEWAALTPDVAHQIEVQLPEDYRYAHDNQHEARAWQELDRVARLNGWVKVEE